MNAQRFTYNEGEEYTGTVTEFNEYGTVATVKLDNKGNAKLYYKDAGFERASAFKSAVSVGKKVCLIYNGKIPGGNGNLYDNWGLKA